MTNPNNESKSASGDSTEPHGSENGSASNNNPRSLADELVQLNDDFVDYLEINAFLSHAFASALTEHEWLSPEIISGARRSENLMQPRLSKLRDDLQHVLVRYQDEQKIKMTKYLINQEDLFF
jgi:hypothetical protein